MNTKCKRAVLIVALAAVAGMVTACPAQVLDYPRPPQASGPAPTTAVMMATTHNER